MTGCGWVADGRWGFLDKFLIIRSFLNHAQKPQNIRTNSKTYEVFLDVFFASSTIPKKTLLCTSYDKRLLRATKGFLLTPL